MADETRLHGVPEAVREAAEAAHESDPDLGRRIDDLAASLNDLADRDDAPDERRVHAHRTTLRELHGEASGDARVHLERALDDVDAYWDDVDE